MQRLLLVEDHASFRQTLALVFDQQPDFEVVAQAGSLGEARQVMRGREFDLGVIDLALPDGEGVELIEEVCEANPAVEAGASGILHKSADVDEILETARRLAAGETLISSDELVEMLRLAGQSREEEREARESIEQLTPREMQVLKALAEGLSNKQIAERLHMSVDTERTHMMNILSKLGVHSRLQALLFAARYGLVEIR
jgi:DNA-binding NarL/FixJ family response regulator